LIQVGVQCEPDLHAALVEFAARHKVPLSVASRELLRAALTEEGAQLVERDLRDAGYKEGYRQGLRDLYSGVKALAEKIR
jgi:hypothetical protein